MSESLRSRLETDLKSAMRGGDTIDRDTIRYLLAALKNAEIEKRGALEPTEELSLLQRQAKRQAESIEQFRAGGRDDLAQREEAQLAILKRYLPSEMSDDEVDQLVQEVVSEVGATSLKDMAKVMQVLIERSGGRASGSRLSASVRTLLAGR